MADMIIKVSANTKEAKKQLEEMGFKVESITKKVKEQATAQDTLAAASKKANDDMRKGIVNTLAKYTTVAGLATLAIKGTVKAVKELVEAAKENNEDYAKLFDGMDKSWTNIKKNLGSALLNTITPALNSLYAALLNIEKWASRTELSTVIKAGGDLSGYSDEELRSWLTDFSKTDGAKQHTATFSRYYNLIQAELERRQTDPDYEYGSLSIDTGTTSSASGSSSDPLADALQKYGSKSASYQLAQLTAQRESLVAMMSPEHNAMDDYLVEIVASLDEEIAKLGEDTEDTANAWDKLADTMGKVAQYSKTFTGFVSALSGLWEQEASNLEDEMENEELSVDQKKEKQQEIDRLKKKAFQANKVNSLAEAAISGAQAVLGFLADPGGILGIALAATAGATTAVQMGTIASQQYTPSYAVGAYNLPQDQYAQVHKGEMIIPKTFAEEIRSGKGSGIGGCTVNIVVQGNADEEVIFHAIERAQRTGLLPAWKYGRA